MHSGKEMKDGIRVNPDESKIQSARRVMNALIKCTAAMAKHLAWEGGNSVMHRITAEIPTFSCQY